MRHCHLVVEVVHWDGEGLAATSVDFGRALLQKILRPTRDVHFGPGGPQLQSDAFTDTFAGASHQTNLRGVF
jgi:hypothetical protein